MRLKNAQVKQIADFLSNLSLVFIAVILTPLFANLDNANPFLVVLGVTVAVICFSVSLVIVPGEDE